MTRLLNMIDGAYQVVLAVGVVAVLAVTYWVHDPESRL